MATKTETKNYSEIRVYRAANGHVMAYWATAEGEFQPGYSAYAWCADECRQYGACSEGLPLEDW